MPVKAHDNYDRGGCDGEYDDGGDDDNAGGYVDDVVVLTMVVVMKLVAFVL